jgi:non-homologous end joining protein Ku
MALRAMWSGVLELNALFKLHVAICSGSQDYRGKDPLKELCSCHHQPFERKTVCEGGRVRLTEAMQAAGETDNTTDVVKGVAGDGDEYVVLDDDAVAAIAAAGTSDGMNVTAVVPIGDLPRERTSGLYYLKPDPKVKRSKTAVEAVCAALKKDGTAIITKWAPRGREMLVAIYAQGDSLVLSALKYESEVRVPDEAYLIGAAGVEEPEVDATCQLLATLPSEFDFSAAEDDAVTVRQEAIAAARGGEPIPTRKPAADTEAAPDLLAALRAATEGAPAMKDTRSNGRVPVGAAS